MDLVNAKIKINSLLREEEKASLKTQNFQGSGIVVVYTENKNLAKVMNYKKFEKGKYEIWSISSNGQLQYLEDTVDVLIQGFVKRTGEKIYKKVILL